jgi:hypothetical protein
MVDGGAGKSVGLGLKITMFDVVQEKPVLAPINYAFLSSNGQSYAGKESGKHTSEDGVLLVLYDLLTVPALFEVLLTGDIEFNFNRHADGSDVKVPVNLFAKHAKVAVNFGECSQKLLQAALSRLE